MDLFLMILRFLFGMPAEAREVEPIVVHADGRTSSGRQWLASQRSIQSTMGASTHRRRFLYSQPDSQGRYWERLFYFRRIETRFVSRLRDNRRTPRT